MTRFLWIDLLTEWSQEIIDSGEYAGQLPLDAIETGWLGFPGASDEAILAAEARLGTTLPPSYHEFIRVTNGWRMTTGFAGGLRPVEEVGWLAHEAQELIDAWLTGEQWSGDDLPPISDEEYLFYGEGAAQPFRSEYLTTALAISNDRDGIYLLNPQTVTADGEWEAWFFAHWVPGADRYRSFWDMMQAEHERFLYLLKSSRGEPTPRVDPSLGVDARDLKGLLAALRDPDQRLAALDALANLRDRRALEPVLSIFQDPAQDLFVREQAARTLGRLRDPRAVQPLLDVFRAKPAELSGLKLSALLGSQSAEPGLLDDLSVGDLLDRMDVVVGKELGDYLRAALTPETVGRSFARRLNHAARQALLAMGDAAFPDLFEALGDADPGVRREVASLLCHDRRREGVFERLLPAFDDPDPGVRAALAAQIEQLFDPRAVDPLLAALEDADAQVRVAAARSLGIMACRVDDQRVAMALAAVAEQDPDPQVRSTAAQSLSRLGS
jgi:HEAT repeat protein